MTNTTRTEEPKPTSREPGPTRKKKSPMIPSRAICKEPAGPEPLLTDMKFVALRPNHRCSSCERIQNRAIQTVKLKKGEGPIKPKDLQDVYSRELTPELAPELDMEAIPELSRELTSESKNELTG